jgi:hypothetical protein
MSCLTELVPMRNMYSTMKLKLSRSFPFILLLFSALGQASELPSPLNLVYRADVGGMGIGTLNRELSKNADGIYTVVSETNATGIAALLLRDVYRETSNFKVEKDVIYPQKYNRAPVGKPEKARIAVFDWNTNKVSLNNDRVYDITPGVQDAGSFLFYWMLTPPVEGNSGTITLVDGKRMTEYEYRIVGEEKLETLWGKETKALRVERQKKGEKKKILRIWLAIDRKYLPVKIENVRPNYTMTFTLEKAEGI